MINYFEHASNAIINEMNNRFTQFTAELANNMLSEEFNEYDMIFRIGGTIKNDFDKDVRFRTWRHNGLLVEFDGIAAQTKFLRNWRGHTEIPRPKNWKESFQSVYEWLDGELSEERKNTRIIVMIWPTNEYWRYLLQFGDKPGANPRVSKEKLLKFPFIKTLDNTIGTLTTDYQLREKSFTSDNGNVINVRLIGDSSDVINVALFW